VTETGLVLVRFAIAELGAAPAVVGLGDASGVVFGELDLGAADAAAGGLAGVDEEDLPAAVRAAVLPGLLVTAQEPQAGRNLGVGEQLARQGHHALHHVVLDHAAADVAFAALGGGHAAVGQHDAGAAAR